MPTEHTRFIPVFRPLMSTPDTDSGPRGASGSCFGGRPADPKESVDFARNLLVNRASVQSRQKHLLGNARLGRACRDNRSKSGIEMAAKIHQFSSVSESQEA